MSVPPALVLIAPGASALPPLRVAVVGSGIAGMAAAHALHRSGQVAVTLFESGSRFGGHAHTVDVTLPGADGRPVTHGVDTGFLVYNERTYPGLIALLQSLGVETADSDMSFSVQAPDGLDGRSRRLEWNGASLNTVFAQRRNLVYPAFYAMLREIMRFNALATRLAQSADGAALAEPLSGFLARHRFGTAFSEGYLLPMIACIWSCPMDQMLQFPVSTLARFCHNHGLLQWENRPAWRTVRGGSRQYVNALLRTLPDARLNHRVQSLQRQAHRVSLHSAHGSEAFDAVVLACHAPQALQVLGAAAHATERAVLSPLRTQPNEAVLHTDPRVMPRTRAAWAAWNFERAAHTRPAASPQAGPEQRLPVCLHYWINRLQPLPFAQPVFVSLNPLEPPLPDSVLGRYAVEHPVFDAAAQAAQRALPSIQGQDRVWFAGAWCGYGFHEDGLQAGQAAARGVLEAAALGLLGAHARAAHAAGIHSGRHAGTNSGARSDAVGRAA
jgi:uncharacterized protein